MFGHWLATTYKNLDWRHVPNHINAIPSHDRGQHNFGCYSDPTKGTLPLPIEEQLVNTFRRFDVNRDGLLSWQELKNAFQSLGARFPANFVDPTTALYRADSNGDGYISEDEMKDLVRYALSRGYHV